MVMISYRNHQPQTFDTCYVSNILTVGLEPVISFFKGEFFLVSLPYSFFMVYVMNKN
jgi:hypothetical protein